MDDSILKLRLDMLDQNLQTALRMTRYLTDDLAALGINTDALQTAFEYHTDRQQRALKGARDKLGAIGAADRDGIRAAWSGYAELNELNARIYREFLEAMLGLAIRRNAIDEAFCKIADALILNMKSFRIKDGALAIPASQEAYSRTLARLVRMRFPEWSIWSMPLVAHEFGHVVIEDVSELEDFAKEAAKAFTTNDPDYVGAPNDEREKRRNRAIERRVSCHVRQLIADAFAVHTIGPSYACSLILLRLSPVPSDSADVYPQDAERATVAIEMLRRMGDASRKSPYTDIIERLEQDWASMIERSGGEPLPKEKRDTLNEFVVRIKDALEDLLVNQGYKTSMPGGWGWNTAFAWYDAWAQHPNPNDLPVPGNITSSSRVHDAFNAAWAYRLFAEWENLEPVAQATRKTCEAIIEFRQENPNSRTGGGKAPGGA